MADNNAAVDMLVIGAHPDDAEIGCGGAIILAIESGLRVGIADLTRGELSTRGTPESRTKETQQASQKLGIHERWNLGLSDAHLRTSPSQRLAVIQLIRTARPRVIFAPWWQDRHPDHAIASQLIQEAAFFAGVRKVGTGQPHRPAAVFYYMCHYPFDPTFVVDISTVWNRKLAAIHAYASQFESSHSTDDSPSSLSDGAFLRAIEARSIWLGAMIGAAYGEGFLSKGPLAVRRFPDIFNGLQDNNDPPSYSVY